MKRFKLLLCVMAMCAALSKGVLADSPIQLALWPPIQLVGEDQAVRGLRLQIYGRNSDVNALDLGFAHEVTGSFGGIQLGLVGAVEQDMGGLQWNAIYSRASGNATGWQQGLFSQVEGNLTGIQQGIVTMVDGDTTGIQLAGLYNMTGKHISGAQIGLVNRAESVRGLQFGLVNLANQMNGLQIGLWNQIDAKPDWKIIPLVNWQF